ncbi:MAG: hypothetical protein HOB51_00665 [Thaumarchaeota archaeon]|jgi:hypothetical protein|nr:hypothetical protein [Nitrososphaerota archaeon]
MLTQTTSFGKMQTNAFSQNTKNTLPKKCGDKGLMNSIRVHLRQRSDESPRQVLFYSGLKQNGKKMSKRAANSLIYKEMSDFMGGYHV